MGNEMLNKHTFSQNLVIYSVISHVNESSKIPTKGFMNHIISAVAKAVTFDQILLSKHYYLAQWILSIWI